MSAEQHDRRLEPTDDSIAALQHAVASSRALGVHDPNEQDILQLIKNEEKLDAEGWLAVASLAMQAYEEAKHAESEGSG